MQHIWNDRQNENTKVQVAEQYFLYQTYSKVIEACQSGKIGNVEFLTMSCDEICRNRRRVLSS